MKTPKFKVGDIVKVVPLDENDSWVLIGEKVEIIWINDNRVTIKSSNYSSGFYDKNFRTVKERLAPLTKLEKALL